MISPNGAMPIKEDASATANSHAASEGGDVRAQEEGLALIVGREGVDGLGGATHSARGRRGGGGARGGGGPLGVSAGGGGG